MTLSVFKIQVNIVLIVPSPPVQRFMRTKLYFDVNNAGRKEGRGIQGHPFRPDWGVRAPDRCLNDRVGRCATVATGNDSTFTPLPIAAKPEHSQRVTILGK